MKDQSPVLAAGPNFCVILRSMLRILRLLTWTKLNYDIVSEMVALVMAVTYLFPK